MSQTSDRFWWGLLLFLLFLLLLLLLWQGENKVYTYSKDWSMDFELEFDDNGMLLLVHAEHVFWYTEKICGGTQTLIFPLCPIKLALFDNRVTD